MALHGQLSGVLIEAADARQHAYGGHAVLKIVIEPRSQYLVFFIWVASRLQLSNHNYR